MRKIVLWLMATITTGVLLFGYHTSTEGPIDSASATVDTAAVVSGSPEGTGSPAADASSAPVASAGGPEPSASSTIVGPAADTRWGPVQVQIVVSGGTITDVTVPVAPANNNKDKQINARALPVLIDETLDAQSTDIDMVSGATVTSEGYVESLQAALDEAGL
ncbi:FMN-binding protein [Rhodococcus sp. NPDC003318]|uniref:FMN-binding protein n=1 Tax=Rhodococcus sp. NPDC003318 TaxID=3364503 RepID=UPI003677BABB